MSLPTKGKLKTLREQLEYEYIDSRKAELRREIAILEESLEAERKAIEELQGRFF